MAHVSSRLVVAGALVAVTALVAVFVVTGRGGSGDDLARRDGAAEAGPLREAGTDVADALAPSLQGTGTEAPVATDRPLPPPVDLEHVDRDRDLHGIVLREDET
ncbi:MAG: hypothetical protein ACYTG6_17605, partial [Planctomycetota bacterium]